MIDIIQVSNIGNIQNLSMEINRNEKQFNIVQLSISEKSNKYQSTVSTTISSDKEQTSNTEKVVYSLIAGATAGALAKTVIAPLDRTKINFQIENKPFDFREAIRFLTNSYKEHGIYNLWRGNSATMARVIPYAAIQYCAHEQFKRLLKVETNEQKRKNPERSFIAGSLAGAVSTTATYPLDLARARMAVTNETRYKNIRAVFKEIISKDGFIKLYKGYIPTLMGVVPYAGTSFFTYETLKRLHNEYWQSNSHEIHPIERLCFGAVAGLLGQSASYPLDIVRRRMQTKTKGYDSILFTIRQVLSEGGVVHGLYKGLSLNWIKGSISVGVSFTTFDILLKLLSDFKLN